MNLDSLKSCAQIIKESKSQFTSNLQLILVILQYFFFSFFVSEMSKFTSTFLGVIDSALVRAFHLCVHDS